MEKKIIEIINRNINIPGHLGTKICGQQSAAKEIFTLFKNHYPKEFVEYALSHRDLFLAKGIDFAYKWWLSENKEKEK